MKLLASCRSASLRKKLFYTFSFTYFAFTFSERVCEYNFFQCTVVLLVIYLFNHDSFKPTIFTIFLLNMSFEVFLSAVSCNIKLFALCFDRYFFCQSLIILHHGDNNFLFWHLYQIHTFNNNLNEEGMITSHFTWCVLTSLWYKC